jgi:hypothetical protein
MHSVRAILAPLRVCNKHPAYLLTISPFREGNYCYLRDGMSFVVVVVLVEEKCHLEQG